jgi:hypothetical protein
MSVGTVGMIYPKCGKEIEVGYIEAESFAGGMKWREELHSMKARVGVGGETISGTDMVGLVRNVAHRCRTCRLVTFEY